MNGRSTPVAAMTDTPARPHHLAGVFAGLIAGVAGGLFGVGGGLVLVPILTSRRFGLTQHQAHGTSLAAIGATALVSVIVYALHHNVAWTTAAVVALSSVVAARWGARLALRISSYRLAQAFAAFLGVVAIRLLWSTPHSAGLAASVTGVGAIGLDLAIGVLVGLLAGFMGVGGGIIAVPAFTLLLGMTQQLAQGTSLAVILVTAPFGAMEHHRHGNVVMPIVPALAIGAALGSPLAAQWVQHLPQLALTRAFAVFILVNAVNLWIRAEQRHRAQTARP